jgi:hypothetical protein
MPADHRRRHQRQGLDLRLPRSDLPLPVTASVATRRRICSKYNERVRIDGRSRWTTPLYARPLPGLRRRDRPPATSPLTYFEFGTLAALEVFLARQVEVMILEVGLGGRLDAVNAYDPDCAVVTGVALDHTDWLGPTRESIGFEKAGIFRAGKTGALCGSRTAAIAARAHAQAIGADLHLLGRDFGYFGDAAAVDLLGPARPAPGGLANPGLRGAANCAMPRPRSPSSTCFRDSGLPVPMQAVRRGLIELGLPGRFQVLPGRPTIVLDVAHNPQAVGGLADNLGDMGFLRPHDCRCRDACRQGHRRLAGALGRQGGPGCWPTSTCRVARRRRSWPRRSAAPAWAARRVFCFTSAGLRAFCRAGRGKW